MRLVYCVSVVGAVLGLCEGWTTTTTRYPPTTAGPGVNLKGKMVTLSQDSGVTFFQPYDHSVATTTSASSTTTTTTRYPTTPKTSTTTTKSTTTTTPKTTATTTKSTTTTTAKTTTTTAKTTTTTYTTPRPTPATRGVTVCLRFLVDRSSVNLFTLAPDTSDALAFALYNQWYTLTWNYYYQYQVTLNPSIPLWSSVQSQPWTSVCLVVDFFKYVVQVFQGGSMSIRKIPPVGLAWSGQPVVRVSGLDGQVTDLEVWHYPLENYEILGFMNNYGPSGTVLTWSNIAYRPSGNILVEKTYALGNSQPISSDEGESPPIRSRQGRGQRLKRRRMNNGRRQWMRETL